MKSTVQTGQYETPTEDMYAECQELLQMFGLPYIIAPMEVRKSLLQFGSTFRNTPSCNCAVPHCNLIIVRTSPNSM